MSGSSTMHTPPVSPAEMQVLVSRAGLTLNPGQMADLVLAWRQMVGLLKLIPRARPMLDDQAFVFRLPSPPLTASSPVAAVHARPAGGLAGKKPAATKLLAKKLTMKKAAATPAADNTAPAAQKTVGKSKAAARKTVQRRR
jgi:hypothetical protein